MLGGLCCPVASCGGLWRPMNSATRVVGGRQKGCFCQWSSGSTNSKELLFVGLAAEDLAKHLLQRRLRIALRYDPGDFINLHRFSLIFVAFCRFCRCE